jgi:hypothetical protein
MDIKGSIDSVTSGKYDETWYYFSTRHQLHLKFNDAVHDSVDDYTRYKIAHYQCVRLLDICGSGGERPWPTYAEKERFFAGYGLGPRYY